MRRIPRRNWSTERMMKDFDGAWRLVEAFWRGFGGLRRADGRRRFK